MTLAGKTLFITGASRGIGLAIALRAARDGANIVIAAKTAETNPKLPGTIHSAAAEIEALSEQDLARRDLTLGETERARAVQGRHRERLVSALGGFVPVVHFLEPMLPLPDSSTMPAPLVRVPATEYHFIARVLDGGAMGIR